MNQEFVNSLTPEKITRMTQYELKQLAEYIKKTSNVQMTNDLTVKLIKDIDSYEEICKNNWKWSVEKQMANYISKGKSTLPEFSMILSGQIICKYLCERMNKLNLNKIKIIDPLAGNGIASNIIYQNIKSKFKDIIYIASDIQDLSDKTGLNSFPVEFSIDCIDSINKHQEKAEILLLVCPPPCEFDYRTEPTGFVDYFAIKRWTELEKKVLIFIGEMGFSDGTKGIYDYLINHSIWKLHTRYVIAEANDIFGRNVKKEIFIFENSFVI